LRSFFLYAAAAMPARLLLCSVIALAFGACAPEIGDDCKTALDCSSQGSRLCDRTQPGGYCTIKGCEDGTCPEESVCVKFRPRAERLAVSYCMFKCDGRGDCRSGDGYECTTAADFGTGHGMDAEVLGRESQRFCAVPALAPEPESSEDTDVDASMSIAGDASTDAATAR
jgi:hypothetical protein